MSISKRVGLAVLDTELRDLINASTKIFPLTQQQLDGNLNPNLYEYGRLNRNIYVWLDNIWQFVIADDPSVEWTDVVNKPSTYNPIIHDHTSDQITDLHVHLNKPSIDVINDEKIALWDTVSGKANALHDHDGRYYLKSEIDGKLTYKSDTNHTHDDLYYTKTSINAIFEDIV